MCTAGNFRLSPHDKGELHLVYPSTMTVHLLLDIYRAGYPAQPTVFMKLTKGHYRMTHPSAFARRAWEKYPAYYADEEQDNLDDDPRDHRNTSKTLAEELAICEKRDFAVISRQKQNPPVDPEKRTKARIGKRFLQSGSSAAVVGSQGTKSNHAKDSPAQGKFNAGIQQDGTSNGELQESSALETAGFETQLGKLVSLERAPHK